MAAGGKAKQRYAVEVDDTDGRRILIRLVSTALTGFFYTTSRPRIAEKMAMMKYDPVGELRWLHRQCCSGSLRTLRTCGDRGGARHGG